MVGSRQSVGLQMEKVDKKIRSARSMTYPSVWTAKEVINVECKETSGDCALLSCLAMMARKDVTVLPLPLNQVGIFGCL
jgi:hypothetical protein